MTEIDFGRVPLFADLSPPQLDQLHRLSHLRTYEAGETVFREGEPGIGVFVVTSGIFELRHDDGSREGQLETVLRPGEVFGLTSLMDDEPRRVSAYAATEGACSVLTRMTFRNAVSDSPLLALEVIRSLAKSLRDVSSLVEHT
jgi:CRP/FNR family transcriptional regulator, cyclic AMP receptor protein